MQVDLIAQIWMSGTTVNSLKASNRFAELLCSTAVEVFVIKAGQIYGFETLNYNEYGLLIREVTPTKTPFLKLGEKIEGVIGQNPMTQIDYCMLC